MIFEDLKTICDTEVCEDETATVIAFCAVIGLMFIAVFTAGI